MIEEGKWQEPHLEINYVYFVDGKRHISTRTVDAAITKDIEKYGDVLVKCILFTKCRVNMSIMCKALKDRGVNGIADLATFAADQELEKLSSDTGISIVDAAGHLESYTLKSTH